MPVEERQNAHIFQRLGSVSKSSSVSQPDAKAAALASAKAWLVVNALLRLASLSASAAALALDLRMRFGFTAWQLVGSDNATQLTSTCHNTHSLDQTTQP